MDDEGVRKLKICLIRQLGNDKILERFFFVIEDNNT